MSSNIQYRLQISVRRLSRAAVGLWVVGAVGVMASLPMEFGGSPVWSACRAIGIGALLLHIGATFVIGLLKFIESGE